MSVSAADLRALAASAQGAESPTSAARLARRFVDNHKYYVTHAARNGQLSVEFEYTTGLRTAVPYILQFFCEDFPGVQAYPRMFATEGGVTGTRIVVTWA